MPSRRQSPPSCPPRYRVAQERGAGDLADEIAAVADLIGYPQLDWQRDVTRVWSTYDEDGQWVHRRNGASVPRQAGKSVDGIVWATTLTALLGYSVLWTDHNYSTTCEMLKRFQRIFGRKPGDPWGIADFNKLVRRFNSKTAQEAFELTNGGVLAFSTRTKSAALGYSFDVVFYDEAQELTGEHMQAITPTTAAGPHHNTQDVYLGTPTRAGSSATKFRELRDEAIGDAPGDDVSWFEWGGRGGRRRQRRAPLVPRQPLPRARARRHQRDPQGHPLPGQDRRARRGPGVPGLLAPAGEGGPRHTKGGVGGLRHPGPARAGPRRGGRLLRRQVLARRPPRRPVRVRGQEGRGGAR